MDNYDSKRKEWIGKFGSDKGFNEWFTKEVMKHENTSICPIID
jgi:hypothetical protein